MLIKQLLDRELRLFNNCLSKLKTFRRGKNGKLYVYAVNSYTGVVVYGFSNISATSRLNNN